MSTIPTPTASGVRAVLFDADGVLQLIGTPWPQALARAGGATFAPALLSGEGRSLAGRETLRELLARLIDELGLTADVDSLMSPWWRASADPVARELVGDLKAAGYLTVLATNQHWERREWMRTALDYDGLCDIDAYSCTLGAAKPDPGYFQRVLELAGSAPEQALFVDDNEENIEAAGALGIRTVHHPADAGGAVLREEVLRALAPA